MSEVKKPVEHMSTGRPEAGAHYAALYNEAQFELAALREELATAKRDSERYQALRKVTPYRFKKMQDASVTDGGDVLYFHADKFDALMDAELTKPTESGASK